MQSAWLPLRCGKDCDGRASSDCGPRRLMGRSWLFSYTSSSDHQYGYHQNNDRLLFDCFVKHRHTNYLYFSYSAASLMRASTFAIVAEP